MITIDDFKKIDLRVVRILAAERVEGSDKLLKLSVSLGFQAIEGAEADVEPKAETRQIIAGIGKSFSPEELIGKEIVVVANLEPRSLMGLESQGMVLAARDGEGGLALVSPTKEVSEGTQLG